MNCCPRPYALTLLLAGCSGGTTASDPVPDPTSPRTFTADVWADNWFALYLADALVLEDTVPITTERSFNSETFDFDASYPLNLNFVVKDYKQDDTGLEYIGAPNQQMGDGGFIFQITDNSSGLVIAFSDRNLRCLVLHQAPLDKGCERDPNPSETCTFSSMEEPDGWQAADFDTTDWSAATEYTEAQVDPKDGYDRIRWDGAARLVWTSDLETDNTLLCKISIAAP